MLSSRQRLALALLALTPTAVAQEFHAELRVEDLVDGAPIRRFLRAVVDDEGVWQGVLLRQSQKGVLVRDGVVVLLEGQQLTQPPARIRTLGETEGAGENLAQLMILDSFVPPRAYSAAWALLHRGQLLVTVNEPVSIAGLPGGTLSGPIEFAAANEHGTVLASVQLDGDSRDLGLLRFDFAPDGTPLARTLALRSGQALPDGSILGAVFGRAALNERGDWLVRVTTLDDRDHLVAGDMAGNRVLLRADTPAPIPGRNIDQIQRHYDLNDLGGYAASAYLDGDLATNAVLIKNGMVLFQEGELLPSLSPTVTGRLLVNIGLVRLSNAGNVYWQALVGVGLPSRGTFLRDERAILQTGVSRIDGELVTDFEEALDNFDISPSGRFWIGRVVLETSGEALVTADFGASLPLPGCAANPGTLRHTDGLVLAGSTIRLVLDGPAAPGAIATVHFASAAARPGQDCGLLTGIGEILIDPLLPIGDVVAGIFAGGPVVLDLPIPPNVALVNREIFAQGSFVRRGVLLTNGLKLEIGAP